MLIYLVSKMVTNQKYLLLEKVDVIFLKSVIKPI